MDSSNPSPNDVSTSRVCNWCPGGEPLARYHPDGQPEHRPTDIPEVVRERHDEPASDRANHDRQRIEVVRRFFQLADDEYGRGARDALLAASHALRNAGPVETQAILDVAADPRRTIRALLVALGDVAGQAGGERS